MTVLYFGPIAENGKPAIGGYEAANRKNIDTLISKGIKVVEFANPRIGRRFKTLSKVRYLKLFLNSFISFFYIRKRDVVVHTTYLHGSFFMFPNALLSITMKLCGIKNVLDVRAGSTIELYNKGNLIYKLLTRITISCASVITVEGKKYLSAIPKMSGIVKPMYYFPNLFDCKDISLGAHKPNNDEIRLFYFGAIKESKGIYLLLELIEILDSKYHLYLAGAIANDILETRISKTNRVHYLGKLTKEKLHLKMSNMHFFVFPTNHEGEGQSNSLIEAMGEGLIPITSSKGFCTDVVGDCGSVLSLEASAVDYKIEIERWTNSIDLYDSAKRCQEHIIKYHNLDVEIDNLINIYKSI